MTTAKRIGTDLLALGFAAAATALFADAAPAEKHCCSTGLTETEVRAEAAAYLEAEPTKARLDRATGRWKVTDGRETAWLDARSGELVEIEFSPPK